MKPLKLTLCGWGPYKNETEVDFDRFEGKGIFLIAGATGAGKTTIFDGITYALYGRMSGEMREKGSVRSDFAEENTKTYVNLKMRHNGKEYEITRNPEYLRPKKRKGKDTAHTLHTREKENAVLLMPDGTAVEGSTEVNRKVCEILAMDERQFKQITMIAQGEFAKLLSASGSEKTRIFRELFGTGIYERFAEQLRSESKELYKEIQKLRYEIEEDISLYERKDEAWEGISYSRACELLKQTEKKCKSDYTLAEKEAALKDKIIRGLVEEINDAKRDSELFQKQEKALFRKEELAKEADTISFLKEKLLKSEAAHRVSFYEKAWRESLERKKKAADALTEHAERKAYEKKEQEGLLWFYENKKELQETFDLLTAEEELLKSLSDGEKQEAKRKTELKALQAAYEECDKDYQNKKQAYDEADGLYRRAVVGVAARLVKAGEPCPVCGSLEHPHVARLSDEIPDEETLKTLKEVWEESDKSRQAAYSNVIRVKGEAGEMEKQLEALKQNVKKLSEQKEKLSEQILSVIRKPYAESRRETEDKIRKYESLTALMKDRDTREKELLGALREEEAAEAVKRAEFEKALKKEGFQTEKEYGEVLLEEAAKEAEEERVKAYEKERESLDQLLLHLSESLSGKQKQNIHELEEQMALVQEESRQLKERMEQLGIEREAAVRTRNSIAAKQEAAAPLEEKYGWVKDLDNLVSGNNKKRLVFEQFVLASYFEDILRAANLRFSKMTGGRYELLRLEEALDGRTKDNLEMLVMDYYTGKKRGIKTLSGGEAFKASLALALGMSDVIQAASGGIRVEALFIDEGFGSLDSESLEQACETLMSLTEKDKLIGIISHVPELRERIDSQIIVEKTNHGSYLKTNG